MSNQQITKNIMIMERQKALNQYRAEVASYEQYGTSSVVSFEEWLEIKGIHLDDELSIEEKAKRYDDAKSRMSRAFNSNRCTIGFMKEIFPELAESEDEKIIKEIITHCKNTKCVTEKGAERMAKWIAWLEKQGRQIQETADNVEPKFNVGDWIVWQDKCYKVNYNGCGYELVDQNGLSTSLEYGTIEKNARLWDITKDAKDGDVLACENGWTCIFTCLNDNLFSSHCFVDSEGWFCEDGGQAHTLDNSLSGEIHPATKKHCDRLFHKMKEAGYMWDDEKKELKKIEDENYDGEDYGIDSLFHAQRILEKTLGKVDGYQTDDGILSHKCAITAVNKLYKQKSAWSEEDEMFVHGLIRGLSAKRDIHGHTTFSSDCIDITETINWLKSLKDRYAWKPSDEQLDALQYIYRNFNPSPSDKLGWNSLKTLELMYHDLKKLKGE